MNASSGRVLVSGASGLIGDALLPSLKARGYQISRLTRTAKSAEDIVWDPARPLAPESVSGFDAVIHLSGEPIVGRWTEAKKRRVLDSRVQGTRNLVDALIKAPERPRVLITASAIGYYGNRGDEIMREDSKPGRGFLPTVCREWEAASSAAEAARIRTVKIRIGLVLSTKGGALKPMLTPFRLGVGGKIGSGKQWWSWIALQDLISIFLYALDQEALSGPVNGVGPRPVTNADFTKILAAALHRPAIFPVPAFAARLAFGREMADELLLASQRVEPTKLIEHRFPFQFSDLAKALEVILKER